MAATLAAYIIRKPGVALVTEVLASVVEPADGQLRRRDRGTDRTDSGRRAPSLPSLCSVIRKWDLASMYLASVFSATFIFCYELYYLNYYRAGIRAF